jgi:hypothetical protein
MSNYVNYTGQLVLLGQRHLMRYDGLGMILGDCK